MQDLIRKAGEIVLACMDDVDATSSEVLEFSEAMLNLAEAYDVVSVGSVKSSPSEAEAAHTMLSIMGIDEDDADGEPLDLPSRILVAIKMLVEPVEDALQ